MGALAALEERRVLRAVETCGRVELGDDDAPTEAFAAWDEGDFERALELLQEAVGKAGDAERRDSLRAVMVGLFTELGADDPLAREHRRRLAAALS